MLEEVEPGTSLLFLRGGVVFLGVFGSKVFLFKKLEMKADFFSGCGVVVFIILGTSLISFSSGSGLNGLAKNFSTTGLLLSGGFIFSWYFLLISSNRFGSTPFKKNVKKNKCKK